MDDAYYKSVVAAHCRLALLNTEIYIRILQHSYRKGDMLTINDTGFKSTFLL